MANDNFYPGQMPGQPLGTGEGESPLVKPAVPNMDVRTMASDAQSINTGGAAPKPYAPPVAPPANIPSAPSQPFQIPQIDVMGSQSPELIPKKSSKGIFTALIVFVAVIGLAALSYFVIYPVFFAAPITQAPVTDNQNEPIFPEPVLPVTANPEPAGPAPEPTPSAPIPTHISIFTTPADSQIQATAVTTGATLSGLSLNTAATPSLSEIIYKDLNGNLIKFADMLKMVTGLTLSSNPALASAFRDPTATGLVYTESGDARSLGFAVQLASGADTQSVSAAFQQAFESITDYGSLFSTNPGTAQTWKTGQVTGATNVRYLLFSNAGFALDYGWVGNKLVIVTSYNGFKEAVRRLQ